MIGAVRAPSQLRLLMALRWRMMRLPHQRRRFALALLTIPLLSAGAIIGGLLAPDYYRFNFALLAPTTYASFLVLAVLAPASSAGGSELFPSEQLVAFPVRERTVFASTVLLAPANLAWIMHLGVLIGVTTYVSSPGPWLPLALLTALAYAASATVFGQAVAWWLEGMRQRRTGRIALRTLMTAILALVAAVQYTGHLTRVLDRLPTRPVAISAIQGSRGMLRPWAITMAVLSGLAVLAVIVGERGCRWSLNRVSDGGLAPEARPVTRRDTAQRPLMTLLQVDRASVWRAAPLRRGAMVLAILPGVIAALTEPTWDSLVLLTGLVSAGAGLLFGVNAFGMDGPGALTLEGLPVDPSIRFWSKALTVLEFCGITTGIALAVGAVRADQQPNATQMAALLASELVCCLAVTAFSMKVSIRAPHRADLRGRRDTPAPPGSMIAYSARLAWRTTWIAVVLSLVALTPWAWLPILVATPMACLAGISLVESARAWRDDTLRAQVVTTVSSG